MVRGVSWEVSSRTHSTLINTRLANMPLNIAKLAAHIRLKWCLERKGMRKRLISELVLFLDRYS